MSPPRLPDLAKLSDAQKNQLIKTLYDTLLAVEAQASRTGQVEPMRPVEQAASIPSDDLAKRIADTAPSRRAQTTLVSLRGTTWSRLLNARPLQILLLALALGFGADFAAGWYQRRALESQRQAALALRSAAFDGLYVELVRVAWEPDGRTYRATFAMQNSRPDAPLYVMMSPVRVFVQAGLTWQETPSQAAPGTSWGVTKLDDSRQFAALFRADVKDWTELIPGYMHVRIDDQMLISRSATPKDDIIERKNVFYVYLKPRDADDEAIKRRSRFPGKPPLFIPMPPH